MPELLEHTRLADPTEGARYLLGATIERTLDTGEVLTAQIVETESYFQADPASHTYRGYSERNKAMFGPAGHAYIYFTYGMHWCFNVTAGPEGEGAGILIRAAKPLAGTEQIRRLRGSADGYNLTNGPAKLAQALAIDKSLYGHDLHKRPLRVYDAGTIKPEAITTAPRIGIRLAANELLRFYITASPYVSKK